jgi:hypothetical protein
MRARCGHQPLQFKKQELRHIAITIARSLGQRLSKIAHSEPAVAMLPISHFLGKLG